MRLFGQLSWFGFVGLFATLVHVAMGLGLHNGLGMKPFWANLVAFCCALGVSFVGQTRLTFPDAKADTSAFLRFVTVTLAGLGLNQAIVWVVASVLEAPYWLALAIIVATVPWITFGLLNRWALRH